MAPSLALIGLAAFATSPDARACSICRCGDAAFNALGRDGLTAQGFRAAIDWERFDKDEGDPADEKESLVEQRYTALVAYGVSDGLTFLARVPYSVRDLTTRPAGEAPEETHATGLSDPEFFAQVRLWASPLDSSLGRRSSLALHLGVKTPWGQNDVQQDGERIDEHAQPGTGSTDFYGGLALLHLFDMRSAIFASAGYRRTGENDFDYRYGSAVLASVAYEHRLGRVLDGVVEVDYRDAAKDRVDAAGSFDPNTGGSLLYLTPRLLVELGHGVVLRFAGQFPLSDHLNGFQDEHAVANVGLTYLFGP